MSKMITVYHGSTILFDKIDVGMGKPYKDFGRGFYVTENPTHARQLAERNKRIERERYNRKADAYLYTYEFDVSLLKAKFKVKEFTQADIEWMKFVLDNRKAKERVHDYSVIIGPTADDDTSLVLKAYFDGLYGDINSDPAIETALKLIEADKLPPQIYFSDNDSAELLKQKGEAKKI
ncbi:MAG: DUF3990 domain-containing protein [Defluviitaleaceae bacterium]|nr:DUF3990 domain-containing protein [Defluviitaleaceae bacterium]